MDDMRVYAPEGGQFVSRATRFIREAALWALMFGLLGAGLYFTFGHSAAQPPTSCFRIEHP